MTNSDQDLLANNKKHTLSREKMMQLQVKW